MNWLDLVILVVWGGAALWGYSAGLIQIVIPLGVVIVGLAISSRIAPDVGAVFSGLTDNEGAQNIGGFILIFLGLFIISAVASFFLRMMLKFIPLAGLANSLAGMAAAVIVGFLLLSGILTGVQKFTEEIDPEIHESGLASFLADNFDVVIRGTKLIPGDWDDEVKKLSD